MTTEQPLAQNARNIAESGLLDMGERKRCLSKTRLDGKVVVITGANTGIGKETALQLSLRGPKIYIGCRDVKKAEEAIDDIKKANPKANITALTLNLSSLKSVRDFVNELEEKESVIDILINNAGARGSTWSQTEDGFETTIQVNYLGHFLLTLLLMPLLKKSTKARVINVSGGVYATSKLHLDNINLEGIFEYQKAYAQSKLAQILFTREFARRLGKNSNVNVYVLHPGVVETQFSKNAPARAFQIKRINVEMGAQTTLYCAFDENLDGESGFYYDNCHRMDKLTDEAQNDNLAKELWDKSCDWVKLDERFRI